MAVFLQLLLQNRTLFEKKALSLCRFFLANDQYDNRGYTSIDT